VVAGFSNSANDALPFGATMTPATGITLGAKDLYVYGAALAFPTLNANNGTTYGAANFVFTEIPEPSTLLLSFSAFAAGGLKKRLSKRS
jgi:hypothetical protein